MRIVSLLPSLSELVCALGHGDELVGVTHECDFPPEVRRLPHLTRSAIPSDATSAEIDALVQAQSQSLYQLDAELLGTLRPDLILTQAQCDVCAVNEQSVRQAAAARAGSATVESVNPTTLAGVHAMFRRVGELLGARDQAEAIIEAFHATAADIARRRAGQPKTTVVLLEWTDPPFVSGHWNPELIALAGGIERLGRAGEPSRRCNGWAELAQADPDLIIVAPCGFTLEQTGREVAKLMQLDEWRSLRAVHQGRVALVDGSAYFSRPGPRLETSLRIAAAAIDPERCGELAPAEGWAWLRQRSAVDI